MGKSDAVSGLDGILGGGTNSVSNVDSLSLLEVSSDEGLILLPSPTLPTLTAFGEVDFRGEDDFLDDLFETGDKGASGVAGI